MRCGSHIGGSANRGDPVLVQERHLRSRAPMWPVAKSGKQGRTAVETTGHLSARALEREPRETRSAEHTHPAGAYRPRPLARNAAICPRVTRSFKQNRSPVGGLQPVVILAAAVFFDVGLEPRAVVVAKRALANPASTYWHRRRSRSPTSPCCCRRKRRGRRSASST